MNNFSYKTLSLLLLPLSTALYANAQAAEVELVGNLDASVVVSKVKGKTSVVEFASGFRHGSSIGLIGREDLGGGNEVGFFLDQGFSLMDGAVTDGDDNSTSAFSREAMLYVSGDWGKLGLGRFGTLSSGTGSFTMLSGWVFGTTYTTAAWSEFGRTIPQYRLDNAAAYVSPEFSGFNFSLVYSNGTVSDTRRWSQNNHYYGAAVKYQKGRVLSSLVLETADRRSPGEVGRLGRMYEVNYGLEVGFGSVTGMFAYQYNAQVRGVKDHIVGLSTRAAAAGGDILFGVRGLIGNDDGAASNEPSDRRAWSVNAAYEYPLSKRTTLWAYGAFSDGSKQLSSKYSVGQVVNYNGAQAAAGMTHKF